MTDRDTFAAAALTGLIANEGEGPSLSATCVYAYRIADAMLAVRDSRSAKETNLDAAPAARASVESVAPQPTTRGDSARTDKAVPRPSDGTGDIPEAQIDALECVVEGGRIVGMSVYGHLRSLLVRLRPEWEHEADRPQPVKDAESDRSKPISDERLAALEELSALDQKLELEYGLTGNPLIKARPRKDVKTDTTQPRNGALSDGPDPDSRVWETPCTPQTHPTPPQGSVPGEGSVRVFRNANEPVAWWLKGSEYDTGCEYEYVSLVKESADAAAKEGGTVTPLYRAPTLTDEEREAVRYAELTLRCETHPVCEKHTTTLRQLLARLA